METLMTDANTIKAQCAREGAMVVPYEISAQIETDLLTLVFNLMSRTLVYDTSGPEFCSVMDRWRPVAEIIRGGSLEGVETDSTKDVGGINEMPKL